MQLNERNILYHIILFYFLLKILLFRERNEKKEKKFKLDFILFCFISFKIAK